MMEETGPTAVPSRSAIDDMDMGGGSVLRLLIGGEQSKGSVTVVEGTLHQGGPPLHVHDGEDEVVIVLDGQLAYRVADERGTAGAGDVLWFPRHLPHTIANLSTQPCRFVTVATPSGIEELFRAQRDYISSLPPGTPPDPKEMERLAGTANRRVVGPPLALEDAAT